MKSFENENYDSLRFRIIVQLDFYFEQVESKHWSTHHYSYEIVSVHERRIWHKLTFWRLQFHANEMSAMSDIYDGSVSFISRFLYLFGIRESQDERKRVDDNGEKRA